MKKLVLSVMFSVISLSVFASERNFEITDLDSGESMKVSIDANGSAQVSNRFLDFKIVINVGDNTGNNSGNNSGTQGHGNGNGNNSGNGNGSGNQSDVDYSDVGMADGWGK